MQHSGELQQQGGVQFCRGMLYAVSRQTSRVHTTAPVGCVLNLLCCLSAAPQHFAGSACPGGVYCCIARLSSAHAQDSSYLSAGSRAIRPDKTAAESV